MPTVLQVGRHRWFEDYTLDSPLGRGVGLGLCFVVTRRTGHGRDSWRSGSPPAWARTDRIFDILAPEAWLAQPISLRHPFIFYVGHLPAFAWNHVCGGVLERPPFNAAFDELFSRGIDPDVDDPAHVPRSPGRARPLACAGEVLDYRDRVRAAVLDAAGPVADRAGRRT